MTAFVQIKNGIDSSFWNQLQKCMRAVFDEERDAVTFLGYMHEKGLIGDPNLNQALEYMGKQLKRVVSMQSIDIVTYRLIRENPQSLTLETYHWVKKAAALGNAQFKRFITQMSPIIKHQIIRRFQMNHIQHTDKKWFM